MSKKKEAQTERADLKSKRKDAQEAAASPNAGSREQADLKLAEQEEAAAKLREKHPPERSSKLDESLKATFPGSDPVAVTQPGPSKHPKKR